MKKTSDLYVTKDFNLVVSAKTAGIKIEISEKGKNGQVVWYLTRSTHLDRILQEYFTGTLSLPVQSIFYNQRLIKSQIVSN